MNLFTGDYTTFYKFFGGYARNSTLSLTKKYKSGVCACCGTTKKEIQSAHKRGFERAELVKKLFYESVVKEENGIYHINLDNFEESFVNFSKDISNFHFLCENCHKKYDNGEINESNFKYKTDSIKNKKSIYLENKGNQMVGNSNRWTRATAKEYCCQNGFQVSRCYTFANENSGKQGIFWANPNPDCLKKDWDIILNCADDSCLRIFRIPANSLTINDFYVRRDNGLLQLEIDKGSYVETMRNINLRPFLVKEIKY